MNKGKLLKQLEDQIEEWPYLYVDQGSISFVRNYELHRIADALEKLVKGTHSLGD